MKSPPIIPAFIVGIVNGLFFSAGAHARDGIRDWTPEDSIAVRYFVAQEKGQTNGSDGYYTSPIVLAPDGKHFFFVYRYGDLATDRAMAEMRVYSIAAVRTALAQNSEPPKPLRKIDFGTEWSDDLHVAISEAHWETAGTILFGGVEGKNSRGIYRLDILSGSVDWLSSAEHDISSLANIAVRDRSVIYGARKLTTWRPLDAYPMATISGDELTQELSDKRGPLAVYSSYQGAPVREVLTLKQASPLFGAWISPDGRWAIIVGAPGEQSIPTEWKQYDRWPRVESRFMLVDLQQGSVQPALPAPAGTATKHGIERHPAFFDCIWSDDSKHAFLINTALPLDTDVEERAHMSYAADFSIQTRTWKVVEPLSDPNAAYSTRNNHLTKRAPARKQPPTAIGMKLDLIQSANEPPRIVATNGSRKLNITEPDPALEGIWRSRLEQVEWQDAEGKRILGGLMQPRNRTGDGPPPLIIQAFHYQPHTFRPDGPAFAAYAAQALVARGFAVLAMSIPIATIEPENQNPSIAHWQKSTMTPQEGALVVQNVDAAIEILTSRKLIDPTRVGLIGFSRGGFMTYYTITHPGRHFVTAAIVDDGHTGSFAEYALDASQWANAYASSQIGIDKENGGSFWQQKAKWLENAPAFNVDRVRTPTLFRLSGPPMYATETVGVFRLNARPFEQIIFRNGSHQLQRPLERLAMMSIAVDWMAFWIMHEPPSDPARRARWEDISQRWQETQRKTAP